MLSELQTAKLDRRFELLDYDGDGVISSADFDLAAQNVCRALRGSDRGGACHRPAGRSRYCVSRAWGELQRRVSGPPLQDGAGFPQTPHAARAGVRSP